MPDHRGGLSGLAEFFRRPLAQKAACISDLSYAGYVASGEEVTAGEADYSEIFTVCKDVPLADPRVRAQWPCHGPVPWPDPGYRDRMNAFTAQLGAIGDKLLRLVALALELPDLDTLTRLAHDGWHHMRVLRFPAASTTRPGARHRRPHRLRNAGDRRPVRRRRTVDPPPVAGEMRKRNWLPGESSAGMYENEEPWTFVTPVPDVLTVFPGDILQFLTDGYLLSTPHKVRLADRERFALAYFHEPNFAATVRPLLEQLRAPTPFTTARISPTCSCAATRIASPPSASCSRIAWPRCPRCVPPGRPEARSCLSSRPR